jgi:hypothetical protein
LKIKLTSEIIWEHEMKYFWFANLDVLVLLLLLMLMLVMMLMLTLTHEGFWSVVLMGLGWWSCKEGASFDQPNLAFFALASRGDLLSCSTCKARDLARVQANPVGSSDNCVTSVPQRC